MANAPMFTTALSAELLQWLREFSKEQRSTQRSVLEEALKAYRFQAKRRTFAEGFKRASKDADLFELAEMGVEDYEGQLKQLDL